MGIGCKRKRLLLFQGKKRGAMDGKRDKERARWREWEEREEM